MTVSAKYLTPVLNHNFRIQRTELGSLHSVIPRVQFGFNVFNQKNGAKFKFH